MKRLLRRLIVKLFPDLSYILSFKNDLINIKSMLFNNNISKLVRIDPPSRIYNSSIMDYSYICLNSRISNTTIGKFTSVGPNFISGWGIHPSTGLSTSPSFYSLTPYNGHKFNDILSLDERSNIYIGNDVFIGINVTILDGVTINDGAIIAAGAVVVDDVPPYAIYGGVPAKLIKYRFSEQIIEQLLQIKWWDWPDVKLKEVSNFFFNPEEFVRKYSKFNNN